MVAVGTSQPLLIPARDPSLLILRTSCPGLDLLVCDYCEPPARMETSPGQPWLLPLSTLVPSTRPGVGYLLYICCMNG